MVEVANKSAVTVRKRSESTDAGDILAFLIPCLQFIQINVIGVLNGADLMLLLTFVFLVFRGRLRIASPAGKKFLVLCSLWLVSQCRDGHREAHSVCGLRTRVEQYRHDPRQFCRDLHAAVRTAQAPADLRGGLAAGTLIKLLIRPDEYARDPWKFGTAYPVCWLVMLYASREKSRGYEPVVLCVIVGAVNVAMGTRAIGGFCLIVAMYLLLLRFIHRKGARVIKLRPGVIVAVMATLIVAGAGILWAYGYAAGSGMLGEDAREKYEAQSSGKYGVLVGGRVELLGSIPAIYDSPILGHGSWARDPKYLIIERQAMAMLDIRPPGITPGRRRIGHYPDALVLFWRVGRCGHSWRGFLGMGIRVDGKDAAVGLSTDDQVAAPGIVCGIHATVGYFVLSLRRAAAHHQPVLRCADYYVHGIASRHATRAAAVTAKKRLVTRVAKNRLKTA